MLCGGSIIYLFGCLRVRMFKRHRRIEDEEAMGYGRLVVTAGTCYCEVLLAPEP